MSRAVQGAVDRKKAVWTGIVFPLILLLYPLRHIHWGLDLMDTGYNYANFQFMGMEHMDPMWLFSTYLANLSGWLMTRLPFGRTLLGMNFYTALTVCLLALLGYWFCVRKAGMPPVWAFLGEFLAISLCWSPTAVLYNYLTYVLFLGGSILLYRGLTEDRNLFLVLAGVCLGANVLVRFSNLPEMGLIVAVWAYALICRSGWKKVLQQTGWCLLGYLAALGALLGWIGIRYGISEYVNGIIRLFGMTENAPGYTPVAMVLESLWVYVENLYWVIRLAVILGAGLVLSAVLPGRFERLKKLGVVGLTSLTAVWLYVRNFCSVSYQDYDSMLRPGILFLMLAMLIGLIQIVRPKAAREEKLLSGMIILILLITPLGSNNHLFPALNNLFLAAPYVFWKIAEFCRSGIWKSLRMGKKELRLPVFPVQAMAVLLAAVTLVQGAGFGLRFVFVEGDGGTDISATVSNNRVLSGIRMSPERAEWMTGISAYVEEQGLEGREVILYGRIPSLSFYLQMPSAFNPWSDLDSYSLDAMDKAMEELETQIGDGALPPVVILEKDCGAYVLDVLAGRPGESERYENDQKLALLVDFMKSFGYEATYRNEKFTVLEAGADEK